MRTAYPPMGASRQAGLTLIEFMVSIVIGMLMVAALATLIANQSASRAEIDRSGKMIENGRYAVQTMANDLLMAGYWGEMSTPPALDAGIAHYPCTATAASVLADMPLHVQVYDSPATLPSPDLDCLANHLPGTDVLVVRRLEPDTTDMETAGVIVPTKAVAGQIYLQTGLSGLTFASRGPRIADGATDAAAFNLTKRNGTPANIRKVLVHIYYVAQCSVPVAGVCTNADGGTPIPTLKRVELGVAGGAPAFTTVTLAEGIENMQIDYGVDTDGDGTPNNYFATAALADQPNIMAVKIHVIARGTERVGGFTDTRSYALGTASAASAPAGAESYRRHVFVQSVRLVNPTGRRTL